MVAACNSSSTSSLPLGQVAAGFDSGEELVEAADLVGREQEHPLVLQGAARADGTSRAGARAVGE